jgi:hypothetical protein
MIKHLRNLVLLIVTSSLVNCERDDICSSDVPTTPRLIIEFYDATEPENLKDVPSFTVYGENPDLPVPVPEDFSSAILIEPFQAERLFNRSTNIAKLPLITGTEGEETVLRYVLERRTDLRLDDNEDTNSNTDIIEISYVPQFEYVSRACGFKSVFTNLRINIIQDDDNWLLFSSFPDNDNTDNITVTNENSTHINLFH